MLSTTKSRTAGKNLKTTMIAALLMLAAVGEAVAQEKWEYANVKANLSAVMFATADNLEVIPTKLKENEKETLKKLNELNDKGWEVYAVSADPPNNITVYYLRKKKN
jgi:hypothetical protein